MSKSLAAVAVASVGFFGMSVLVLAVWPGKTLEQETRAMSPKHPLKLTASQQRGREIYSREGCAYCHTQQIRMLDADMKRFGPSTEAWETQFDYPHLWGTRRIGPDLSREGSLHPEDWHFVHLYAPQSIVTDSVMPAFPSLFDGPPDRPKQSARDLLAYLQSLGQARAIAQRSPAPPRNYPHLSAAQPANDLYKHNCAGCHGEHGDGQGAAGLSPRPANLGAHEYKTDRIASALWNGIAGTSMPAWRDFPQEQLAGLAATVQSFKHTEPVSRPTERGAKIYNDNCAECHGEKGQGDGAARSEISVLPTNFTLQRPGQKFSIDVITSGIPGTPMAPWNTRLNHDEIEDVANFVRGFYR